jgi:hypothetical protein
MSNFGDHPAGFFGDSSFYNGVATTSLRLDDGSAAHLHRTPAADSSDAARKKYTFSTWVKRASLGTTQQILAIGSGAGGAPWFFLYFLTSDQIQAYWYSTTSGNATNSAPTFAPVLRDTSAWYNIVLVVDTTDGTATDRFKLYINGVRAAVATAGNALLQNFIGVINSNIKHYIGSNANTEQYLDAYLSDTNMIDGTALGPDSFGEFKNGIWIPIDTSGLTFGANGFRLQYTSQAHDAPASEGDADTDNIGADSSGENNHWTALDAIVASDCAMPDSPENNFCTLNPLFKEYATSSSLSEGNLKYTMGTNGVTTSAYGSMAVNQNQGGKWYAEVRIDDYDTGSMWVGVFRNLGLASRGNLNTGVRFSGYAYKTDGNATTTGNNGSSYGASYATNNVIGIALDLDNNAIYFYKDGAIQNSGTAAFTSITTNSGAYNSSTVGDGNYIFGVDGDGGDAATFNFGQDSTFNGQETAGGNTDANGIGDFHTAVPSGYLSVCAANIPEPTIGPNSATQADNHFDVVLYTGNSSDKTISGLGFQPDWVWSKSRSLAQNHHIHDSARGVELRLNAEANNAEISDGELKTFTSDGFTFDTAGATNTNNATNVAWCWHANSGTATATISESGDNPAAVVQANPTAGFSLITYTGTGDTGTIAHGLGAVPTWILIKNRDQADSWAVYHGGNTAAPETDYLVLDTNVATADGVGWWDDTAPTSSVFTVHDQHMVNADGEKYVAYVFADVEGYSKMGSYISNGNVDGAFIYLGFRPKFVIVKRTNATYSWMMYDTERDPSNVMNTTFFADLNNAESASDNIDFVSNGIKLRTTGNSFNGGSGSLFVYMAFAEAPFKYANAR